MAAEKKGRLTLYEDLLSKETIAEMQAKDAAKQAESAKKKSNASLLAFKPTSLGKKPGNQPKAKPKPNFSAMHKYSSSESTPSTTAAAPPLPPSDAPSDGPAQDTSCTPQQSGTQPKMTQKRGFSDWLANEDEEDYYIDRPRHERGGRKKKKKKQQQHEEQTWSWDDIYDPTVPTPFLDFSRSDSRYDLNEDWKRRLYDAHKREMRRQGRDPRRETSEEDLYRPRMGMGMQFAPPGAMSFAPPGNLDSLPGSRPGSTGPSNDNDSLAPGHAYSYRGNDDEFEPPPSSKAAPPPAIVDIDMEETADAVYARRMAMSNNATPAPRAVHPALPPPPPPPAQATPPLTAAVSATISAADAEKKAKVAAQIAAMKAKLGKAGPSQAGISTQSALSSTPQTPATQPSPSTSQTGTDTPGPQQVPHELPPPPPAGLSAPSGTISAAPTFNPEYHAQKQQAEVELARSTISADASEEERTSRPGQTGFAERLMKKLGWEKGQGLGASGEGITTALQMKADKRKKKSDAQGGGFVTPANMGKIVGGKKAKVKPSEGSADPEAPKSEFDGMSEVVKLEGMLENMDVDHEIAENNLMQEIGDEMGTGYGKVERLFIWRKNQGGNDDVFVKFTSPLSAVRCLKGMDGVEFADNEVKARFWDAEKFERGEYA